MCPRAICGVVWRRHCTGGSELGGFWLNEGGLKLSEDRRRPRAANGGLVLEAAKNVLGDEYTDDRLPIEYITDPAVKNELKRFGFTHALLFSKRGRPRGFEL